MILITDGSSDFLVTKGAYLNFFKGKGFHEKTDEDELLAPEVETGQGSLFNPQGEEINQEVEDADDDSEALSSESPDEVSLSEIPLAEMTTEQLEARAKELGLNPDEFNSRKEARVAIRKAMKG